MLKRLTKACRGAGRARRSCAKRATRAAISMLHGWAADARSCSLVLVPFACAHCIPARFTSSRCLLEFPVGRMTPLACRAALAPAVTAAPFLPRFVFLPKLIQRAIEGRCRCSDQDVRQERAGEKSILDHVRFDGRADPDPSSRPGDGATGCGGDHGDG